MIVKCVKCISLLLSVYSVSSLASTAKCYQSSKMDSMILFKDDSYNIQSTKKEETLQGFNIVMDGQESWVCFTDMSGCLRGSQLGDNSVITYIDSERVKRVDVYMIDGDTLQHTQSRIMPLPNNHSGLTSVSAEVGNIKNVNCSTWEG